MLKCMHRFRMLFVCLMVTNVSGDSANDGSLTRSRLSRTYPLDISSSNPPSSGTDQLERDSQDDFFYPGGQNLYDTFTKGDSHYADDREQFHGEDEISMHLYPGGSKGNWNDAGFRRRNNFKAYQTMMVSSSDKVTGSKPKNKVSNALSKFVEDPLKSLMAIFLPLSIIFYAVFPVVMNMMIYGAPLPPMVVTTATEGRSLHMENVLSSEFMTPVFESIINFESKVSKKGYCMQKALCEVVQEKTGHEAGWKTVRETAFRMVPEFNGSWARSLDVNSVISALRDNSCEKISCAG